MVQDIRYTVVHGPEWEATVNALAEVDATLSDKFKGALEEAARPVLEELRKAALELPAYRAKHTGLRGRIGAGVSTGITRKGIRFTTSMPPGEEELPRGEDSGSRGWRHPVFGHDVWVHQRGGSWFRETVASERDKFERSLTGVLTEAAETIARATHV